MGPEKVDVVIVGGGISGLAAALGITERGLSVRLLERESEVGGTMKTVREDGFLVETGPNSALETTPLIGEIVRTCGLTEKFLYANPVGRNRYVLRSGILHALPLSPLELLTTHLFSFSAKLRLLREPFIGRTLHEESVADFVIRRIGREFLDYAVDPFVAGIYAARPDQLSVRAAFPKLHALEEKYGGLIKGMIQGRRERTNRREKGKDRAETFSFRDGLQSLPRAIAGKLGDVISTGAKVTQIRDISLNDQVPNDEPDARRYVIEYLLGDQNHEIESESVVLSVPSYAAAPVIHSLSQKTSKTLADIPYAPVISVFLGYRETDIQRPLDGFGFLIPAKEHRNILGCLWSSSLFPGRATPGHVALTVFIGGSRNPALCDLDDDHIQRIVMEELKSIMHIDGKPIYLKVTRWTKAIPQYVLGYHATLDTLSEFEESHPGLFFCSNYRGGISIGDCIQSAKVVTERVLDHVA